MLCDFFRINLPYGLERNEDGEWRTFNREYMPLGYTKALHPSEIRGDYGFGKQPIYTKYYGLTEKLLLELAGEEQFVRRDEKGKICKIFLYNHKTNPVDQSNKQSEQWRIYWRKLERLSRLKVRKTNRYK